MAFTFNCTAGDSAANSYVCLADADDYFDGDPRQSTWDALADSEKQQYLVRATNRLEYENYEGEVADTAQALQWPRNYVTDRNGDNYDETTVPVPMKKATYEMAIWYLQEYNEEPLVSKVDQERLKGYTVGPLTVEMHESKETELPSEVKLALRAIGPTAWLGDTTGGIKLVR